MPFKSLAREEGRRESALGEWVLGWQGAKGRRVL